VATAIGDGSVDGSIVVTWKVCIIHIQLQLAIVTGQDVNSLTMRMTL